MDEPLRPIATAWSNKIRLAMEYKKRKFQDDADECLGFFNGPYDSLYGLKGATSSKGFTYTGEDGDLPRPAFCMTVNKAAEMVELFGPVLYHKNPTRQVNPRKPPMVPIELLGDPADPNVQQQFMMFQQQVQQERATDKGRAQLLEHYLNYTPTALDLKTESRQAIDEALIKGLGLLWTEVYQPAGAPFKMIGSFYDTVDNLVIDPDMESLREAKWVAKRCVHPYWEVEQEYGLAPGTLRAKATLESVGQQAQVMSDPNGDYNRRRGLTNDLVCYWKVYSKMGMGTFMSGVKEDLQQTLDVYGKFVYLVICADVPYPLNLAPDVIAAGDEQQVQQRLQWPTPFWADDSWPFTPIAFHQVPREVWPISHLKPGIGELKFINWAYSFLAGKVKTSCRDFIAIAKSAGEELKDAIKNGQDYTFLEVEALHGNIDAVVRFLQHPSFQADIYKVVQAVEDNFEKRVGLTELMYGTSDKQLRSAEEAQVKDSQMTVRPDDMANKVEDAMGEVARKEALAARWHLEQQDIVPVLGPIAAQWWAQLLLASDPSEIIHQLEYRIEAGSSKKPNKARDSSNMQQAMQTLFQPLWQYMTQTGQTQQVNALITAWAKSIELDPTPFLLPPPPPPPPPMPPNAAGPASPPGNPGPGGPPAPGPPPGVPR